MRTEARCRGLTLAVLFLLGGCGEAAPERPKNLIIALVDTLRADHLGVYGYPRDTSPRIDAFAQAQLVFDQARSQAPCTFPSVNSLLTSRHPIRFHDQEKKALGIPPDFVTLPEILRAQGFRTLAVSASPVVRKSPAPHNLEGGFDSGFDVFDETCFRKDAACVNARGLALLEETATPFFLYLHYLDPHGPYRPPSSHQPRFATEYEGEAYIAAGDPGPIARMLYGDAPPVPLHPDDLQHLVDLYDDEIAYFDSQFGLLLDELEQQPFWAETLLALVSDHGEDFLEHGDVKHCRNLYDTQIRVPLIMRVPGVQGGRRLPMEAQNLDLTPTLLDYLGLTPSHHGFEGRSLRGMIESEGAVGSAAPAAWRSLRSIVDGGHKLVVDLRSGESELYDLTSDPGERTDLSRSHPQEVARLRGLLEERLAVIEPDPEATLRAGDQTMERLRELGYLE